MSILSSRWKTGLISEGPCQLEYKYRKVDGKPWMVFLHGFGQDYLAFDPVYQVLEGHFSMLAPHVFFHGESSIEGSAPLKKEDWNTLIRNLFEKLEISNAVWMAYSMGAKFTLHTYEAMPDLFTGITLLAPDGVVMNPWYGFATQSVFGRFCTRLSIQYIPLFRYLVIALSSTGLVRPSLGKFAASQLATAESRELVLNVWLRFRKIWPNERIWHSHLRSNPMPFLVVLGKYDTIISRKRFARQRADWKQVQWLDLEAGHASLVERFARQLQKQMKPENLV